MNRSPIKALIVSQKSDQLIEGLTRSCGLLNIKCVVVNKIKFALEKFQSPDGHYDLVIVDSRFEYMAVETLGK